MPLVSRIANTLVVRLYEPVEVSLELVVMVELVHELLPGFGLLLHYGSDNLSDQLSLFQRAFFAGCLQGLWYHFLEVLSFRRARTLVEEAARVAHQDAVVFQKRLDVKVVIAVAVEVSCDDGGYAH